MAISSRVVARLDDRARDYIARLNEEPCNRSVGHKLANTLANYAEYKATLSFIRYTEKKCGTNKGFLPVMYIAQKGVSDFAAAEITATKLLEESSGSAKFYVWRSEAREEQGNVTGAYTDLKHGLAAFVDSSRVVSRVFHSTAKLAVKNGEPCEAVAIMQDYVSYDHVARRTLQVVAMMNKWQNQGKCPEPFGTGTVRLRYNPTAKLIVMPVKVNGVSTRMVVDTGASRTVLTKAFAKRVGVKPLSSMGAMVQTANGQIWQMGGRAKNISLGKATVGNVPLFIQTSDKQAFGRNIGGLLGLSFLGNFNFSMKRGVLELSPLE